MKEGGEGRDRGEEGGGVRGRGERDKVSEGGEGVKEERGGKDRVMEDKKKE